MQQLRFLSLVFIIALPSALFAGDAADAVFAEGQDHFYNAEYEKATEDFGRYIEQRPEDPRGYWRKAYSLYFTWRRDQKRMFPKLSDGEREKFFLLVSLGIRKAEQDIAAKKDVDFALYVKACLLSMRGGVEAGMGKASLITARATLQETLEVASKSHYQDAKYLVGLANYNGSGHAFWFIVARLPHDREAGLEKIYEAFAMNDGPFADDVGFGIFSIETDPKNAGRYTKEEIEKISCELLRKHPRNEALQKYCAAICKPRGN